MLGISEWKLTQDGKLDINDSQRTKMEDLYGHDLITHIEKKLQDEKSENKHNTNKLTKRSMGKLPLLCALLAVGALEMSDDGVFLNQEQLDAIEAELNKHKNQMTEAATKTGDAEKAQKDAVTAQKAAEESLAGVVKALDDIDTSVKDAKNETEKVEAVRQLIAKKSAAGATGTQKKGDADAEMTFAGNDPVNAYVKENF